MQLLTEWPGPAYSRTLTKAGFYATSAIKRALLRVRRRLRRRPERPWREGLPPGLADDVLERVLRELTGSHPSEVSHRQLSSWKTSGAYRLTVATADGGHHRLVYKNSSYSEGELPAAARFPIHPGPMELEIYRHRSRLLTDYLPRVHLLDTGGSGEFRLIMEDLDERFTNSFPAGNLLTAAREIPEVHAALTPVFDAIDQDRVPVYGPPFSRRLVSYVTDTLQEYVAVHEGPDVTTLLDELPGISDAYVSSLSDVQLTLVPIHGDYNPANVFIARGRPRHVKILDWEWAGLGLPHVDLAKLLNSATSKARRLVFDDFVRAYPQWSPAEHDLLYIRARLERGLIDASYLADHRLALPGPTRLDIPGYIARACRLARQAAGELGA